MAGIVLPHVAVVTGANKGIGYSAVKILLKQNPTWIVYLTARNVLQGMDAVCELKSNERVIARFRQLDVESIESIRKLKIFLLKEHPNGIDVLINNAGVFPPVRDESTANTFNYIYDENAISATFSVNFFGLVNVCKELLPILSNDARIVNVSSFMAEVVYRQLLPNVRHEIANCATIDDVIAMANKFLSCPTDDYQKEGWLSSPPHSPYYPGISMGDLMPYGVSKLCVILITQILQRQCNDYHEPRNIVINACCPGNVRTDLNPYGSKTPDQGAVTVAYAAMLPYETGNRGKYIVNCKPHDPFRRTKLNPVLLIDS